MRALSLQSMAAVAACACQHPSWRARLGPRPLDWVFPPGSPWPVSTWATASAAAPRTAFKQWQQQQLDPAQISNAPISPRRRSRDGFMLDRFPQLARRGIHAMQSNQHPKFSVVVSTLRAAAAAAACRRQSPPARQELAINGPIESRTPHICSVRQPAGLPADYR